MLSLLRRDSCWYTGSKLLRSIAVLQIVSIWIVFTCWLCDVDRHWGLHAVAENKPDCCEHLTSCGVEGVMAKTALYCNTLWINRTPLLPRVTQRRLFPLACPSPTLPHIGFVTQLLQWISCQEKNVILLSLICAAVGDGTPALPCLEYSQHVIQNLPTQHWWWYYIMTHWHGSWCEEIFVAF